MTIDTLFERTGKYFITDEHSNIAPMNNQSHHTARERLSTALKHANMTQRELSDRTGIKPTTVSQLVTGVRPITVLHAPKLAMVLGHTPGYWLGESEVATVAARPLASAGVHPVTGRSLDEWI